MSCPGNTLPGVSFDVCPFCGHRADIDEEKTDLEWVILYCLNCKATGKAYRKALRGSQPEWTRGPDVELYRDGEKDDLLIRGGFSRDTGCCWYRIEGPKEKLLQALAADDDLKERVEKLLGSHLDGAY